MHVPTTLIGRIAISTLSADYVYWGRAEIGEGWVKFETVAGEGPVETGPLGQMVSTIDETLYIPRNEITSIRVVEANNESNSAANSE